MSTTAKEPTNDVEDLDAGDLDAGGFLDEMARLAAEADPDNPTPFAVGTFAAYPTPAGGLVLVVKVPDGPPGIVGERRMHIRPGLIRTMGAVLGGGGIRGLFGGRKRRA